MLRKLLRLSILLLGLSASNVYADRIAANGTWLMSVCSGLINSTASTPGNNYCAGFIQGVMLSWYTAEQQVNPGGAAFWLSQFGKVPAIASAQMVIKYMNQNPQAMSHSAVDLIIAAINKNYPFPPSGS